MGPKKSSNKVEEEEILVAAAGPLAEPPCFFAPDAPSSLAGCDPLDFDAPQYSVASIFGCLLDVSVRCQCHV
jgi:hypothetical protein